MSNSTPTTRSRTKLIPAHVKMNPLITLLFFSTAMLVLPLLSYYCIITYLVNSTTYAAMGAIVMVQIVVAAYVYKAWQDENSEHQAQKRDMKFKKKA